MKRSMVLENLLTQLRYARLELYGPKMSPLCLLLYVLNKCPHFNILKTFCACDSDYSRKRAKGVGAFRSRRRPTHQY